jgi:hypothetical protein
MLDRVIDLDKQFVELFNKEQMLAYFDFHADFGQGLGASGLCKISSPRKSESESAYVSLLFIVDTSDFDVLEAAEKRCRGFDWESFRADLPGFETALRMSYTSSDQKNFFEEVDLYFRKGFGVCRVFVSNRLLPAVANLTGFRCGDLTFWEDLGAPPKPVDRRAIESVAQGQSLVGKLKRLLQE